MKKLISYLITAMMVFTMVPSIAFAGTAEQQALDKPAVHSELDDVEYEGSMNLHIEQTNPLYGGYSAPVIETLDAVAINEDENAIAPNGSAGAEYAATVEEAAEFLRTQMVDRQTSVTISMPVTEADLTNEAMNALTSKIFTSAMNHTGKVNEGDSLQWVWQDQQTDISVTGDANGLIATITYTIVYYTTAEQEAALSEAVAALKAELNLDGKSDYEKVKAIYDYMTANISYDYEHYGDDSYKLQYTAFAALVNKTSVCQGYATLFYRMMCEYGIDARVVAGTSINVNGEPEGHSWNIVKFGDKYYNLDATWDSTWDEDKSKHEFFLRGTAAFENHTRNAEFTTDEFNAAYPMSDADYVPGTADDEGGIESEEPETPAECTHATTEVIPAVAATCSATGLTEGVKCASCGEILVPQEVVAVKDHAYDDGIVTTEPTTTTEGVKTYTCTVCGDTKTESIPVVEETPEDDVTKVTGVWTDYIAEAFAGGEGTATNPYIIESAEELALLAKYVNEKNYAYKAACYQLNNDIDLSGHNWMPIGTILGNNDGDFYGFEGCFDGKGHTISNMTIISDLGDYYYYGLFGMNLGTIKNVKLDSPIISFESIREGWQATNGMGSSLEIGAICGASINRGYIENCRVNNVTIEVLTAMRLCCGGAIGSASEVIVDNVLVSGNIKGTAATSIWMGGNIGSIGNYVFVENCGFEGTVSSENDGEIGFITEETEGCSYLNYVGGFCGDAGRANSTVSIKNCYAIADIYSKSEEGMQDNGGFAGGVGLIYDKACYENLLCKSSITAVRGNETIIEKDFWQGETPFGIQEYCSEWNYKNCVAINGSEVVIRNRDKLVDTTDIYDLSKESIVDILRANGFDEKNWVFDENDLPGLIEHSYGSWIIDKESTCTETGEKHKVCVDCGYEKYVVIAKIFHNNEWVSDETKHYWGCKCGAIVGEEGEHSWITISNQEPTCTESGGKGYKCSVCGYTYTDNTIGALGHDKVQHAAKAATCTAPGWEAYETCTRCDYTTYKEVPATGHSYGDTWKTDSNKHWHECACGAKSEEAVHDYEWIIDIQPTEDTEGSKHQECTVCATKGKTESIGKLGHTHTMVKKEAVAADCETDGNIEYYTCSECGKLYADAEGKEEITIADTVVAATGHIWDEEWTVTKPATLTDAGEETKYCANCDETQTQEFARVKSISRTYAKLVYNGAKRTPVTVKDVNGNVLKAGTDYQVQYLTNCKNVGVHKFKVVLTGKYEGSKTISFTINPKATVLNKLTKPGKGQIKVTWQKRTAQVTGYEIQYSTTANFTKKTTKTLKVKSFKTTAKTIKQLKSKKNYWVKIRTYKTVNGKPYYSAWSKAKKITTK